MTHHQLIQEFNSYPHEQKSIVIEQLVRIYEEEKTILNQENDRSSVPFTIESLSLKPRKGFDFDNIGKLVSEIEGDFHK